MPTATDKKTKPRGQRPIGQPARKAERLRAKVDDRADRRDLEAAIARNAGKPGIPWAKARVVLGIDR